MCFDYGNKRLGIAVTDNLQLIATGLTTIHPNETLSFLKKYLQTEVISCFVIGQPKKLDNTLNEVETQIKQFIVLLKKNFESIPIKRIDERFTSSMAFQTMIDGGLKKKDRMNKSTIDMVSATIILQSFLQQNNNLK